MTEHRLPRKWGDFDQASKRVLFSGELNEPESISLLNDPETDGTVYLLVVICLGGAYGDDIQAAKRFRSIMALPANKTKDALQLACLSGLARRTGAQATDDLERAWQRKSSEFRTLALDGLGFIGDTTHYGEVLQLFKRAAMRGQTKAGGVDLNTLGRYLLTCTQRGVGSFDNLKQIIRSNWSRLAERDYFLELLPGIDDEQKDLDEIDQPTPRFPQLERS